MKVLVACEFSGVVREAFRNRGHDAWSCDILPSQDNSKHHHQTDIMNILKHDRDYDLMIAHPPCTYLCNSGVSHLHKDKSRWDELRKASEFFNVLLASRIEKICVENPIPHKYGVLPKYTQIVQPYQFGHPERKATCLWLKNLPKLEPTKNVYKEMLKLPKKLSQRIHYTSPGKNRGMLRSITFKGIADAMAEQWGSQSFSSGGMK